MASRRSSGPDFDSVVDELYGGAPAEFTATRDARSRAAKAAGDRELAARIHALRKPTAAAAIVNRLARDRPAELAELVRLGERLRRAHTELAGADLRRLTKERHELVRGLLDGTPRMSDPVAREVETTLDSIATDPGGAQAAVAGVLATAPAPDSGDSWLTAGDPAFVPPPKPRPKLRSVPPLPPEPAEEPPPRESAAAKRTRERLERKAADLEKAQERAQRALDEAEEGAADAAEAAKDLRKQLARAEAAEQKASKAVTSARAALERASEAAQIAREAVP